MVKKHYGTLEGHTFKRHRRHAAQRFAVEHHDLVIIKHVREYSIDNVS